MKFVLMATTLFATYVSAILLTMSFFVWQPEGMFWYGLSTIGLGIALKVETDKWLP